MSEKPEKKEKTDKTDKTDKSDTDKKWATRKKNREKLKKTGGSIIDRISGHLRPTSSKSKTPKPSDPPTSTHPPVTAAKTSTSVDSPTEPTLRKPAPNYATLKQKRPKKKPVSFSRSISDKLPFFGEKAGKSDLLHVNGMNGLPADDKDIDSSDDHSEEFHSDEETILTKEKFDKIDLVNKKLKQVTKEELKTFTENGNLLEVDLSKNELKYLPSVVFTELQELHSLKFVENKISIFDFISSNSGNTNTLANCGQVLSLNLRENKINCIPASFCKTFQNVEILNLCKNQIYEWPKFAMKSLKNLKVLKLNWNYITSVPDNVWKSTTLQTLEISHNYLKEITLHKNGKKNSPKKSQLKKLNLGWNQISSISGDVLNLPAFQTLENFNLSNNNLEDLTDDFSNLTHIHTFNLSGNPLTAAGLGKGKWKSVIAHLNELKNLKVKTKKKPTHQITESTSSLGNSKSMDNLQDLDSQDINPELLLGKKGGRGGSRAGGSAFEMWKSQATDSSDSVETLATKENKNDDTKDPEKKDDAELSDLKGRLGGLDLSTFDLDSSAKSSNSSGEDSPKGNNNNNNNNNSGSLIKAKKKDVQIVDDYGCAADLNKVGLKRARKDVIQQEDYHSELIFEKEKISVFSVIDGHGGTEAAEKAKKIIESSFLRLFNSKSEFSSSESSFERLLLHVLVCGVDHELDDCCYVGATATVVLVWQDPSSGDKFVQAANVGDSNAVYGGVDPDADVHILSVEHKVSDEGERKRIEELGVELEKGQTRIGGGIAVSRALGDHFSKDNKSGMIGVPYVSEKVKTEKGGVVVVASDGLWDVMTEAKAIKMVRTKRDTGASAEEAAREVMKSALRNKECKDNITVTVVYL